MSSRRPPFSAAGRGVSSILAGCLVDVAAPAALCADGIGFGRIYAMCADKVAIGPICLLAARAICVKGGGRGRAQSWHSGRLGTFAPLERGEMASHGGRLLFRRGCY